jgi:hypothetical protein
MARFVSCIDKNLPVKNRRGVWADKIMSRVASSCYFTETTGQGASRIIYWALEPKSNFPTFDFFTIPIKISSIF